MCESKIVDLITTNEKHVMVYDYLSNFPITIKLLNDILLGIDLETDKISFMIPDENQVYQEITSISSTKPTLGEIELNLGAHNLCFIDKFKNGTYTGKEFIQEKLLNIKLGYWNRR